MADKSRRLDGISLSKIEQRLRKTIEGRESNLEQFFVRECSKADIMQVKLKTPGKRSITDRMMLPNGGKPVFVEIKRKGEEARKQQLYRIEMLRDHGYRVFLIDNKKKVRDVISFAQWLEKHNS